MQDTHKQLYASQACHSLCSASMPFELDLAFTDDVWPLTCSSDTDFEISNNNNNDNNSNNNHTNILSLDLASVIEDAFSCGLYPSSSPGIQFLSTGCPSFPLVSPLESPISAVDLSMSLVPCTSELSPSSDWILPVTGSDNHAIDAGGTSMINAFPAIDPISTSDNILHNQQQHQQQQKRRKDRHITSNLNRRAKRKAKIGELYSCGSIKLLAKPQPYDAMVQKFRLKK